jgi:hypothetical protein
MQQDIQSSTTQPVQTHIENRDTGAQERETAQQGTASVESRYHKTSLDVFTNDSINPLFQQRLKRASSTISIRLIPTGPGRMPSCSSRPLMAMERMPIGQS